MSRVTRKFDEGDPPARPRRVSIREVARRANVAQGTVSHVLNHPERVSQAKREAVERAIAELGFVRHEAARHLRSGYSTTLGLLLLDAWNPSFQDVARGVEQSTGQDWNLLLANSGRDIERERTYLRLFAEARVAGLIVIPHDEYAEGLHRIRGDGVPVVVIDRAETDEDALSVAVDDVHGGWLIARHLLDLGHRKLVFIGDESAATPVHDRLTGVRRAVAEAGVELQVIACDLTVPAGRLVGERLAALPANERPSAIVTAIDLLAFGVMQAMLQRGIRVPEEVSLTGYDDVDFTRQLSVPLTTVHRPHVAMGETAARLLIATISGEDPPERHAVFKPELVVRDSTAPPPNERMRRQ